MTPGGFNVIELRRYLVHPETRGEFATYFETYFPEAFQQLGAIILGQFCEREDPSRFTWIRAFKSYEDRQTVNELFYGGPVWKEHRDTMNSRMIDHTDVLLLRPVRGSLDAPPPVDAVKESSRRVLALHIVPARPESLADIAAAFPDGIVLETLDRPNNFPPLPFRTDGPYVLWLGTGDPHIDPSITRGAPQRILLDPTHRSRLR